MHSGWILNFAGFSSSILLLSLTFPSLAYPITNFKNIVTRDPAVVPGPNPRSTCIQKFNEQSHELKELLPAKGFNLRLRDFKTKCSSYKYVSYNGVAQEVKILDSEVDKVCIFSSINGWRKMTNSLFDTDYPGDWRTLRLVKILLLGTYLDETNQQLEDHILELSIVRSVFESEGGPCDQVIALAKAVTGANASAKPAEKEKLAQAIQGIVETIRTLNNGDNLIFVDEHIDTQVRCVQF